MVGSAFWRARLGERIILGTLAALVAVGLVLAIRDPAAFRRYTSEQGPVENLTVVAFLGGAVLCLHRAWRWRRDGRRRLRMATTVALAALFVVAAGEELSWGQRLLAFGTPEFFERHNLQRETNLHNLVVSGVKINKLVFGSGLLVVILAYCSLLPWGYRRWPWLRVLADLLAVPVPRTRHLLWYLALAVMATSIPSGFRWELLELVSSTMFLLFTADPLNAEAFDGERNGP